jgi:hypothetical protein
VDTIDRELRELTERYPERKDSSVSGGLEQRAAPHATRTEICVSIQRAERFLECLRGQHPFSDGIQLTLLRTTDTSLSCIR